MKAMQVSGSATGPVLVTAEVPQPQPAAGDVLVRVRAAGVTTTELDWSPTTQTKDGKKRRHAIPGHEFSGVVAALGAESHGFAAGQEVYGMNDWFAEGATAEYCVTQPASIAAKPASLTHEEAATVPIAALTAWQGLLDRAKIQPGERVLVHGGSGSVGIFAIQLARLHGAHVLTTASAANLEFVKELGAEEAVDYRTTRFEETFSDVDVVFDAVGGETLQRSWAVLKPGGRMVTIASDSEGTTDQRTKDAFFIVEPNQKQLIEVANLLDSGKLKTFVNAAVPFSEAATAYAGKVTEKRGYGKVVITI